MSCVKLVRNCLCRLKNAAFSPRIQPKMALNDFFLTTWFQADDIQWDFIIGINFLLISSALSHKLFPIRGTGFVDVMHVLANGTARWGLFKQWRERAWSSTADLNVCVIIISVDFIWAQVRQRKEAAVLVTREELLVFKLLQNRDT